MTSFGVEWDTNVLVFTGALNQFQKEIIAFSPEYVFHLAGSSIYPKHAEEEVELCNEIATESARILHGTYTDRGDEGDHAWKPFACPIKCEEKEFHIPLFGELISEKELIDMFGGSILPGQRFKALSMEAEIQRYEAERRDGDENAGSRAAEPFYVMLQYLRNHQDEEVRKSATYFRSIEDGRGPVRPCVFPHFFVARTSKGSITGVSGLTVWT